MKFATVAAALLPLAYGFSQDDYDSGRVMAKMMEAKEVRLLSRLTAQNRYS
jgi:hypothetical protein